LVIFFAQACLLAAIGQPAAMAVSQLGCLYILDRMGWLR
jgi:hypothetical protein